MEMGKKGGCGCSWVSEGEKGEMKENEWEFRFQLSSNRQISWGMDRLVPVSSSLHFIPDVPPFFHLQYIVLITVETQSDVWRGQCGVGIYRKQYKKNMCVWRRRRERDWMKSSVCDSGSSRQEGVGRKGGERLIKIEIPAATDIITPLQDVQSLPIDLYPSRIPASFFLSSTVFFFFFS